MNDSSVSTPHSVIFTAYRDIGSTKYVLFAAVFSIYSASVIVNVSLMLVVYFDSSLHKPMYIFLCSLLLNGLFGSTGLWPKVLAMLIVDVNAESYVNCLINVAIISIYGSCNYQILTIMAYDRLVSIFKPLQYHTIMTPLRVKQLLSVALLCPAFVVTGQIFLSSRIPLCKHSLYRLFCDNLSVSNLACGDTVQGRISNIYGLCCVVLLIVLPVLLVLLSYVKIIKLSLKASKHARKKAFETCSPHLIIFVNFSIATLFSVVYNRFNQYLPGEINIIMSVNYLLIPPLLHPIIYGIRNKEIRHSMSRIRQKTVFALSEHNVRCKCSPMYIQLSVFSICVPRNSRRE